MWFVADIYRTAKLHAALSPAPVYFYQFSFDGELGFMKRIIGACRFPGKSLVTGTVRHKKYGAIHHNKNSKTSKIRSHSPQQERLDVGIIDLKILAFFFLFYPRKYLDLRSRGFNPLAPEFLHLNFSTPCI